MAPESSIAVEDIHVAKWNQSGILPNLNSRALMENVSPHTRTSLDRRRQTRKSLWPPPEMAARLRPTTLGDRPHLVS